ncbi:dTDP-4-dehydrorhamnose reductase [Flagellimonas pelagia]|uniref:dTDP-4-dehydrorhamnose reductase n=1 Tax=Flagellimonas pelagia TaxID=2306998 RepID=A0A3A1NLG9_9FLAO|nr:dTDP-4-dehydrorhamnose reductase [Allomuricauda maritima]RIV44620.1 dTDP-4-dehydrorhamnose reductase [Allomuricauda maritima]TXJ94682.1 dTDP-4-dehydrorhamnose reductase [Allomuricauda maritima]
MKKVVVTGAGGQLGKTLKELAPKFYGYHFDFKTSQDLDITKKEDLDEVLGNGGYDYCINCAAYTNVEQAEKTPRLAFAVNAEGVKNLAKACKDNGAVLIHISTDYVFDGKKKGPYTIKDETNPINEYGNSKLKGEQYIKELLEKYYILRTSWLYSKKYGHNFYRTIVKRASEGQDLHITDEQIGCPTNTESLVGFITENLLNEEKPFGIYHVTDGKPMTWYDFAEQILKENGLTHKVNLVLDRKYRTFAKRPINSVIV